MCRSIPVEIGGYSPGASRAISVNEDPRETRQVFLARRLFFHRIGRFRHGRHVVLLWSGEVHIHAIASEHGHVPGLVELDDLRPSIRTDIVGELAVTREWWGLEKSIHASLTCGRTLKPDLGVGGDMDRYLGTCRPCCSSFCAMCTVVEHRQVNRHCNGGILPEADRN